MNKTRYLPFLMAVIVLSSCTPAVTLSQYVTQPAPAAVTGTPIPPAAVVTEVSSTGSCEPYNPIPEPGPTEMAEVMNVPAVSAEDHFRGNPDAKIVILEYSDFQCPYCAQIAPEITSLVQKYPEDVLQVFRHFPIPSHPLSLLATQASEAAGLQNKFFEYADELFAKQADWSHMDAASAQQYFIDLATELDLDADQFSQDMLSTEIVQKAKAFQDNAIQTGIGYTPYLMVNGRSMADVNLELGLMIELLMHDKAKYADCPERVIDLSKEHTATIQTGGGDITIKLYTDEAPLSVNSLAFLSSEGWYKDITFFDVFKETTENGFSLAITGDQTGTGYGSAGYTITGENTEMTYDRKGLVGMVNGSQIFITTAAQPRLNGYFTIIGEVVDGLDIVESLTGPGELVNNIIVTEQQ